MNSISIIYNSRLDQEKGKLNQTQIQKKNQTNKQKKKQKEYKNMEHRTTHRRKFKDKVGCICENDKGLTTNISYILHIISLTKM